MAFFQDPAPRPVPYTLVATLGLFNGYLRQRDRVRAGTTSGAASIVTGQPPDPTVPFSSQFSVWGEGAGLVAAAGLWMLNGDYDYWAPFLYSSLFALSQRVAPLVDRAAHPQPPPPTHA